MDAPLTWLLAADSPPWVRYRARRDLLGQGTITRRCRPSAGRCWRTRRRRGCSPSNPVQGWYGLKKGLRGRFGMYVPPLLEALGLAEVEHNPKNNRMRAL